MVLRSRNFTDCYEILPGAYNNDMTLSKNTRNPGSTSEADSLANNALERARLDGNEDYKNVYSLDYNAAKATKDIENVRAALVKHNENAAAIKEIGGDLLSADFSKYIKQMSVSSEPFNPNNDKLEAAMLDFDAEIYKAQNSLEENIDTAATDISDIRNAIIVYNSNAEAQHLAGENIASADFAEYISQMITPDMCPAPPPLPTLSNPCSDPIDGWIDIRHVMANAPNIIDPTTSIEYKPAMVTLLSDAMKSTMFSPMSPVFGGSYNSGYGDGGLYVTSDSVTIYPNMIASGYTHTWNDSYDVLCSQRYKTRYIITYIKNTPTARISAETYDYMWSSNTNSLWCHIDNCLVGYFDMSNIQSQTNNVSLEMVTCGLNCTGNASTVFKGGLTRNLRHLELPEGTTKLSASAFDFGITSFKSIKLPSTIIGLEFGCLMDYTGDKFTFPASLTSIGGGNMSNNGVVGERTGNTQGYSNINGIKQIHIPKFVSDDLIVYVFENASTRSAPSLRAVTCDVGACFRQLTHLGQCFNLSRSSMLELGRNLKSRVGMTYAGTIYFGATNLAKLSADEKLIFTQKNYTLS